PGRRFRITLAPGRTSQSWRRLPAEHSRRAGRHAQLMTGLHAWDCVCGTRNAPELRACRQCNEPARLGKPVWGEPPTGRPPAWMRKLVGTLALLATAGMLLLAVARASTPAHNAPHDVYRIRVPR